MNDILDLTSKQTQSVKVEVNREAGFSNTVDFYEVEADGSVIDPSSGEAIAPGEAGYTEAAIANRLELDLSAENGETSEFTADFPEQGSYAPLLAVDSNFESFSDNNASNDPVVYTGYDVANADGFDHVEMLGETEFGFEDLPNGGDKDFNDLVVSFEVVDEAVANPVDPTPVEPVVPPTTTDPIVDPAVPAVPEPIPADLGTISGVKFDDANENGIRDSELVQGTNPDVVFAIDVSGSTNDAQFDGEVNVGDLNNDGRANDIIDAEIAGFTALNQQLIDQGLGDSADVAVVGFAADATQLDLDPVTAGVQTSTTPNADKDGNGTLDVVDALTSLNSLGGTNFEAGLQDAEDIFQSLETESGNGNLVFISDGFPDPDIVNYDDEVANLNDLNVNISAFGAGDGSRLDRLQVIDPEAQIFTSTDEILNVFASLESDTDGDGEIDGGGSQSEIESGLAGVNIYLDLNNNGELDPNEPSQLTDADGQYSFSDLEPDTYTVREVIPDGFSQTAPVDGQFTVDLVGGEVVEDQNFGNVAIEPVI